MNFLIGNKVKDKHNFCIKYIMMRIGFLLFIISFLHMFTSYVISQQAQVIPQEREMMFGDISRTGVPFSKDPHVVNFDGRYLIYYSIPPMKGVESSGWNIGIAESRDLIVWEKIGEIVPDP